MRSNLLGNKVNDILRLAFAGFYAWPKDGIRPRHFGSLAVVLDTNNAHIRYIAVA